MSEYYDPDFDACPGSPPLQPVRVKVTPSPTPPPVVTRLQPSYPPGGVTPPFPKHRGHRSRLKRRGQPCPGTFVLIRAMYPDRPDIAREACETALNSDSGSESEAEEMEDRSVTVEPAPSIPTVAQAAPSKPSMVDLQATAQKALDSTGTKSIPPQKLPPPFPRDSVVEIDSQARGTIDAEGGSNATARTRTDSLATASNGPNSILPIKNTVETITTAFTSCRDRHGSFANGFSDDESLATSPNIGQLTIPPSMGSPSQTLPALHTPSSTRDSATSPKQTQSLPGFRHLSELAETAIHEQDATRASSFSHRPSVSSSAHSPTSITRQLSISSARSPNSAFPPFNASSPMSANGESAAVQDIFLRSGQSGLTLFSTRRPSQASDGAPYSATIHSASTNNDSYTSSEGLSPGTQVSSLDSQTHRMSIDSTYPSRTLPPPPGAHIQHIPAHGNGGFKCEHPGCKAQPFQTQYLLNSHANVHSQSRPHYCPVANCPRAEGGKGFKRKNEMIRHGLVHESPGYVCPFCSDREHRYPRPDNLQRHVRVHHTDKDKDDAQLREVLAQRPEGGNRGRRRRV